MRKILLFLGLSILILSANKTQAQTAIAVGPQTTTFTSMVRGYFFTAPTNFTICQLYIPSDASTGVQNIEVVRFTNGAPPAYAGTTNAFTSLFYINNYAPNTPIPCNIQVSAGDVIGVYGARGTNMVNSYGSPNYVTTIMGNNATLQRSGMQFNLNTQQMHDIWSEVNYNIGRIIMYINCCTPPSAFPAPIQGDSLACAGDIESYSVDTNGVGFGPTTYNWTVPSGSQIVYGQGTDSIQVLHGGGVTGQICVTAANSCDSVVHCFNMYKDSLSAPDSITGIDTVCATASTYSYTIPIDTNATSYIWEVPTGAQVIYGQGTDSVVVQFDAVIPNATVCAASANSCDTSSFTCFSVYTDSIPIVNGAITGAPTICEGDSGTYTIASVSNADSYTWAISNGGFVTSGQGTTAATIQFPSSGPTQICVEASNACGTSLNTCETVIVNEFIAANAGVDTAFCLTDGVVTGNAPSSGAGVWSYVSGPGAVTFGNNGQAVTSADVSILGTYTYEWEITNGSCVDRDTVEVTYDQEPITLGGADQEVCGSATNLNAVTPNLGTAMWYQISGPGTTDFTNSTVNNTAVEIDTFGVYNYGWEATNGACVIVDTVEVIYYEELDPAFAGNDTVICDFYFVLNADSANAGTGIWELLSGDTASFNEYDPNTPVYPTSVGTYTFRWTVSNGVCPPSSDIVSVRVADPDSINAAFSFTPESPVNVFDPVTYMDQSSGADYWHWAFGNGDSAFTQMPVYEYTFGGEFVIVLTVTNDDGCMDTATLDIEVYDKLIVPNVITPNGDGQNDILFIQTGNLESYSINIFNRFGRRIFESNDPKDYWDGKVNGKVVSSGTYFYVIEAGTRAGSQVYKGNITVLE